MSDRRTNLPAPWRRVDDGSRGKTSARYAHPRGYSIEHCGHPTAIWPYALYAPDGALLLAPNGRAWRTARLAVLEVERLESTAADIERRMRARVAPSAVDLRGNSSGGDCPGCGRVMSVREGQEQAICNDCQA